MWYYAQNGEQVGPVSQEVLREKLQQQSLPSSTLVWREGMATWVPAMQVPELVAGLESGVPIYSDVASMATPVGPPPSNTLAIWSLVLAIASLIICGIFTAIPAVICGHMARSRAKSNQMVQTGDGLALAGLIIGYISLVLNVIMLVVIVVMASSDQLAPPP